MSPARQPRDLAASARARLLEVSRRRKVEFQLMLSDFAIERLLYRLGASPHGERYVLKGAMLFRLWSEGRHRATWDLDLLGRGASTVADVVGVIEDLCGVPSDDGLAFNAASLVGEEIRTGDEYVGVRVRLEARLAGARIPMQVDVGFGDAIIPPPSRRTYPTLLGHAAPRILAYPREVVVAEKVEAMVTLGVTNSRMKDFFDVYVLASSFEFEGILLSRAVQATFERRATSVPDAAPLVLTREFLAAPERQTQWRAFLRRGRLDAPPDAAELAAALRRFLGPVLDAVGRREVLTGTWPPGGPWQSSEEPIQ